MKCENCGKNEVTFVYQSNVNGQVTEKHLCQECAQKLGYLDMAAHGHRMMENFFGNRFFGDSFLDDFFSPMPSLLGRMDRMLEDPFDDFFQAMPALSARPVERQEVQQPQEETLVDHEEQSRFSKMRHLNALKMEMKKAVHKEDFERAAELRDEIRKLESENKTA